MGPSTKPDRSSVTPSAEGELLPPRAPTNPIEAAAQVVTDLTTQMRERAMSGDPATAQAARLELRKVVAKGRKAA